MNANYYQDPTQDVLKKLDVTQDGLTERQAEDRLQKYGKNELAGEKRTTILQKFINQFKDLMIIILLIATVISLLIGEASDALIIFLVVVLNAAFGVFQESKAENAIDALQEMTTPYTRVRRAGQIQQIQSNNVTLGDIILLEAGDVVPADARIIEAHNLKIEESALTGESVPTEKNSEILTDEKAGIGDQDNMAFMNTNVTYGTAEAVVTGIGMETQVGQIAGMISGVEQTTTPLQKNINHLSKILSVLILVIAAVIFIFGTVTGRETPFDMLLTAISLAVAAIPEGLPAIVTITLALGTQTMSKRNALVRKLPAVETLGTTEIIASDKTGTLTQNKMTVEQIFTDQKLMKVSDYALPLSSRMASIMLLANDSKRTKDGLLGDPTETALIQYFIDKKDDPAEIEQQYKRLDSVPFDSDRKLMSAIVKNKDGKIYCLTKGAVDVLLKRTTKIAVDGQVRDITPADRQKIEDTNSRLAHRALRVLAYAYKPVEKVAQQATSEAYENDLIFVGLTGMIDPERPEVEDAVKEAKAAGIRPLMITGDHKETAQAIAARLGIIEKGDDQGVITGSELDELSDEELRQNVDKYSVYARVSPEHKVRIVKAWQSHGKIVAMTGDGVNDAPALKTADIGVGMGITGTEVSKGAADIVLADDNFATIITAVEEGRKVFANIQKAVQYLLSANLGEVLTLSIMTFANWDIFLPVQILWINLVTDTFPAIALGVEEGEPDAMEHKPRGEKSTFLSNGVGSSIIYQGILESFLTLGVYLLAILDPVHQSSDMVHADALTMSFITLGMLQLGHAFNCKSIHRSIFTTKTFENRFFNWAILGSGVLLAATIFIPGFNNIFHVTTLNLTQWGIIFGAVFLMIVIVEVVKLVQRKTVYKNL
ncbi:Ca2+-transporting ATPase [Ligilactobacillus acidipiscis DSM 15836]|uniref:Ca2+-transporting ATPase n=1 Tax=Ligilactobacillus acidipiscis DSM 15836 TaxID=1423716 RepID=A0ABR5PN04_9LACO|nr:cation-translocating P-type ATPase [Ligilactobacillus acidipiscis]KRM31410.1 Ca2+-transporting ATPase [Ligilactobacillus acidipiscis DSM 15836]GAW63143.1 cation-transporting ATPase [Ligilactobacillus acidipiscis]GEN20147.1 ATPase [Ligilactobacillus acidipiscis]